MCIDIHTGSNGSSWANVSDDNPDVTNADLGLAEDHFSHPEVNIIYRFLFTGYEDDTCSKFFVPRDSNYFTR